MPAERVGSRIRETEASVHANQKTHPLRQSADKADRRKNEAAAKKGVQGSDSSVEGFK
jgi:hypothetical protein